MANIVSTKGYSSSYRGSNAPGAFYEVLTSDFGEQAPAAPTLTLRGSTGTLASSTTHVKVAWITAEGVSLPSADAAISVSAANDGVSIAQPTVPTNGATVIGWTVYSQGSAGVLQNITSTGTVPSPVTIPTQAGNVTGFLIATTSVFLNSWGTGPLVPSIDQSGVQTALPVIAPNTGADYYFIVPNSGSQWKNYKNVGVARPDSTVETVGINLSFPLDCQSPLYPGATPGTSTYTQVAVLAGTYMVMNGNLFVANQLTGSQNTAATFVGSAAFNVSKNTVVTDGSVTWLCLGKATLVHARFENILASTSISPVAQEYDLMEF